MSRSFIITASALAVAVGVLLFTIFFSPPVADPVKRDRPLADPTRKFNPLEKDKGDTFDNVAPSGVVEKYYVRKFSEERQQLTVLSGERALPRPNGVIDIEGITAHIHLIPGRRVVEIKGPRGTLVAPDNNPESGVLTGGVVLTLFESQGEQPVKLTADSPDVKLRMYLDEAVKFDLVLGFVESDGPVHLTMPRADFRGTGLNLIYNEKRRRINRLEILQGREMRFNPNAAGSAEAQANDAKTKPQTEGPEAVDVREPDYYRATFENNVNVRTADAVIDSQRLEVVFSMENSKASGEGAAVGFKENGRYPDDSADLIIGFGGGEATSARTARATAAASEAERSLMPVSADDVIVHWTGTLLVEPLEEKPDEMEGPRDTLLVLEKAVKVRSVRGETIAAERVEYLSSAARVHVIGEALTPAVIESPEFGRLHVLDLVLHQKRGVGQITGPGGIVAAADAPPAVKTVTADGKAVAPNATNRTVETGVAPPRAADAGKLPPGVSVSWTDGAELTFHVKEETDKSAKAAGAKTTDKPSEQGLSVPPKAAAPPGTATATATGRTTISPTASIDALKEAAFHGGVQVEHAQFDLASDHLLIAMSPPTKQKQEPQLVKASGHVQATARGDAKQPAMDIQAGDMEITFAADSKGKPQPARMVATERVKASQPGRVLTAGSLDVKLVEAAEKVAADVKGSAQPQAAADTRMTVKHMLAERDATVTLDNPRTVVTGVRLEAEADKGLLQIFGDARRPARVERADDSLTGMHITLRESDQFVTVPGAGSAEFVTRSTPRVDPPKPGAAPAAPAAPAQLGPPEPPQRLKITWTTAMDFNNTTGVAHFYGNVDAGSERGVDLSRFKAGELTLELDPADPKDLRPVGSAVRTDAAAAKPATDVENENNAAAKAVRTADPTAAPKNDKPPARNIRKLLAQHKVVFEAEKWDDKAGGKLATRFRLTGPILTFDNTTEKLDVFGPGTMQMEDYRAKDKAKESATAASPAAAAPGAPASPVAFVGKGITLFLWSGAMSIDANHNDVRMEKEVRMLQQPAAGADIHMQCNQLIADFQSTGGLNSWLTGKANEPKLDNVTANGKLVIIYQKQTVRGDQLHYTGAKQMAVISAEPGSMCELDTEQTTLPARQFRWMLEKDRIIAEEPGAVRTKSGK